MASSNHLVAGLLAVFLLFSHSVATLHGTSSEHGYKFDVDRNEVDNCLEREKETNIYIIEEEEEEGCHFAGRCSAGVECRQPCAALGRNPDAVKCVLLLSAPPGRCCCIN